MGSVMDIYSLVKDLIKEAKERKNLEIVEKLFDMQEYLFDIREENEALKQRISDLEETKILSDDLELTDKGVYIRKSEKESGKNMIYCPACYNDYKKLYPIVSTIRSTKQCTKCHGVFR